MGIFQRIASAAGVQVTTGQTSPWSDAQLTRIAWGELGGILSPDQITRDAAMSVPAVARARGLIIGALAQLPMTACRGTDQILTPTWLVKTGIPAAQTATQRLVWTLDDMIFHGAALWALQRGAGDVVLDAIRIHPSRWSINPAGLILVDGEPVPDATQVCLIQSHQDPLLTVAARTISGTISTERAWSQRVKAPIPMVELHSTSQTDNLDQDEAQAMVDTWETNRAAGGGTAYTPAGIETKVHGQVATDLFTAGRNMNRLDVANFFQVPASLLEGSTATASLTYSTQEGRRSEFRDYSLQFWAGPIEDRLSQDDMIARGNRIRFDWDTLSPDTTTSPGPVED